MISNPFSTKYWSPGVIPYQFSEYGENLESLEQRIREHPICQIVGPHGSGKSTLLSCLLKLYEKKGENVRFLLFNDQQRRISDSFTFQKNEILFVDGFEQLRLRDRAGLLLRSKRLILTTHHPVWFVPVLYCTNPQFSVFIQIVRQKISIVPDESVLRMIFERFNGNFRSAFFELYDLWETGLLSDECTNQVKG